MEDFFVILAHKPGINSALFYFPGGRTDQSIRPSAQPARGKKSLSLRMYISVFKKERSIIK